MLPMSQPWSKVRLNFPEDLLTICMPHPPISFTCLQWLEKLTLSYILAKVPFLFPPFGHESMGVMTINLFMLFSHSVRLCLCVKVDLWETVILKLQHAPESPGSLNQTQISALHPQNFWLKGSEVGLIICFSKKLIKLMLLVGVLHFENHWSRGKKSPLFDSVSGTGKFFNQLMCNLPDFGVFKYHIVCCQNTHQMDSFVLFK